MATLLAAGAASAQASGFTEIQGTNTSFFYDTDFWAGSTATVVGNVITFTTIPDFDVTITAPTRGSGSVSSVLIDFSAYGAGVVAVAHSGYTLSSDVRLGVEGSYAVSATGGWVQISSFGDVTGGTYSNGTYVSNTSQLGYGSDYSTKIANGTVAEAGSLHSANPQYTSYVPVAEYSTLGLNLTLQAYASQTGLNTGTSTAALTSASYAFTASVIPAVTAVPEPETYAMLLAGLGLMGFMVRRRKA